MQREEHCRRCAPRVGAVRHLRHKRDIAFGGFQDLLAFAEGVEHDRPGAAHGVRNDVVRSFREPSLVFHKSQAGNDIVVDSGNFSGKFQGKLADFHQLFQSFLNMRQSEG